MMGFIPEMIAVIMVIPHTVKDLRKGGSTISMQGGHSV